MIFKNYSESASLLAQKIAELMGDTKIPSQVTLSKYSLTFINFESENFAKKVAENLGTNLIESIQPQNLVIIDDGSTVAVEYSEFINEIRKNHPTTRIILAIPIIPESEKEILLDNCDTLLYLHSDPYFFSLDQFYEEPSF